MTHPHRSACTISAGLTLVASVVLTSRAHAHGISEQSRESMTQGGVVDYIWLGAEHMVTGYDHLLFLFGVIFFLTGFRDVVRFITAFTLGHCITLLGATLAGVSANAYLIDAVIALSVIYKGFENLDGFKKTLGVKAPNLLGMVFIFGLIHGFGLSTRLQELGLGSEGIVARILAFNVGVELGQIAALTAMLGFFAAWRSTATFARFGTIANAGLVLAGAGLFAMQVDGYLHTGDHHDHEDEPAVHHDAHEQQAVQPAPVEPDHTLESDEPDEAEAPPESDEEKVDSESGHGHGHTHGHDAPKKEKALAPKKSGHSHSHGSGKAHTH